jgi:hypothetical protein
MCIHKVDGILGVKLFTQLVQKRFEMCAFGHRTAILFRHPRTTGSSYSLLKPFTKTVWLCTVLSWALMMAAIHLVNRLEHRRLRDGHQHPRSDCEYSCGATMLTIFGAISEQGNITSYISHFSFVQPWQQQRTPHDVSQDKLKP